MADLVAHDGASRIEGGKRQLRAMQDDGFIATFAMFDVSLAHMDRAELLGVICFLARESGFLSNRK